MFPVIEQIFHDYNEIFGSSKIYAILKDRGYAISESTVAKIIFVPARKRFTNSIRNEKQIYCNNNFTFLILMKFG